MAILEIIKEPNAVLRKKAKPVSKINAGIRKLLDDMAETMYDAPGVGLAAPQVNVSKRVIVIDPGEEGWGLMELINPEIVEKSEFGVVGPEGCLSIPGYIGDVERYRKIRVTALDRHGRQFWVDAEDWVARVLQHEIDHLDGILYTDTATNLRPSPKKGEEETEEDASEEADAEEARAARKARWEKTMARRRPLRRTIAGAEPATESGETAAAPDGETSAAMSAEGTAGAGQAEE